MTKLAFLGDSITAGVGASLPNLNYVNRVGEMLSCEVANYGISGTRIARQKVDSACHAFDVDFNLRVPVLDRSVDKIFVFGGTNDYKHGDAVFGQIGDTDVYSFHGAVNNLFASLVEIYGKEKVVVILPLKRASMQTFLNDVTKKSLLDYVNVIKYYAELFGLKYINLFDEGLDEPSEGESDFFVDGLHPNDKGHQFVAEKICNFIKNDK